MQRLARPVLAVFGLPETVRVSATSVVTASDTDTGEGGEHAASSELIRRTDCLLRSKLLNTGRVAVEPRGAAQ